MMYAAADFETTGLLLHPAAKTQPRATELAIVRSDGEERSWLFNPQELLSPKITKITGLTDAVLAEERLFAEVWPEIEEFVAPLDELWAHNASFDSGIMCAELKRIGLEWPPAGARWRCTVEEFAPEWGRRPRLYELYEHCFGEKFSGAHRALADTRALMRVVELMKVEQWVYHS